jgi:hypothetical protein
VFSLVIQYQMDLVLAFVRMEWLKCGRMAKKTENAGTALVQMRWDRSTPEERSEAARKAAQARWGKKKKKAR